MQWCFYYPAVLDLRDLPLTAGEERDLRDSLDAYRSGDLLSALALIPDGRQPGSDAERVYYAALLLSVGQVEKTEAALAALPAGDPSERLRRLASALRQLIGAVKREPNPSALNPQLSTELLAASYYEQSRAAGDRSLGAALSLARQAVTHSPQFGFAWARVAELEFSFGHTGRALEALNKGLALAPRNAQALALKGFLLAAENETREAIDWFNQAIAVDSALGNAWLGRGLCRIRRGETRGGREDLLVAAALEPQRSLLRSYLGKAYGNAGETQRAGHEFDLAKHLDAADPTPWLYSALLSRQDNQINAAVNELEKSLRLNDNRRLYRSELLLDQDRAVRSASLASIYREAGMPEVSLREAASAVTYDYANYSAHLFLANSFDALRDPTRFNLRYETAWFNELLLANLLAPVGAGALSPNVSQQEYFRLFERDRLGLASTTDVRSDGQYREVVSQFGSFGRLSYSLDLDWQHNDGVRPNNELKRIEWYSQIKLQLTPQDSLFALAKYQDYHSGDNFQYFDPKALTVETNMATGVIRTNTAFHPNFNFDEFQSPILVAAYHREWAPGVHTLLLGGRLINDQRQSDTPVDLLIVNTNTNNQTRATKSPFDVNYRSELEIYTAELNQILQRDASTVVLGARYQTGQFDTRSTQVNLDLPAFFPNTNTAAVDGFQHFALYAYGTLEVIDHLLLTAGVAYDDLRFPRNYRQVPVSEGEEKRSRVSPKAALVWSPKPEVTIRSVYTRSLGGVSLDESYRLEPVQLGGFSQAFRTLIPESVAGSVSAPTFETTSAALDLKFKTRTYVGLQGEWLKSNVDRSWGVYDFDQGSIASVIPQRLHFDERSASVALNQLMGQEWSLGAQYRFVHDELQTRWPSLAPSVNAGFTAGVYLGGGSQTLVRAIDEKVVCLINAAEVSGSGGGNNTGGGVTVWSPGLTVDEFQVGFVRVTLGPTNAVRAGAAWRVNRGNGDVSPYLNSTDTVYPLIPGKIPIEFKPLPGFGTPMPLFVQPVPNDTVAVDVVYPIFGLSNATRVAGEGFRFTLTGATGRVYTLETTVDLVNWSTLATLTNQMGSILFTDQPPPIAAGRFYRGHEVE